MPSLRWRCKSTLPSHTTNTATVKCLPVRPESMQMRLHQSTREVSRKSSDPARKFSSRLVAEREHQPCLEVTDAGRVPYFVRQPRNLLVEVRTTTLPG